MRISDWSSDVCSSDLVPVLVVRLPGNKAYANSVLATDFSEDALATAQLALRLAPDGNLHLLHAYESLYDNNLAREAMQAPDRKAMQHKERQNAVEQHGIASRRAIVGLHV